MIMKLKIKRPGPKGAVEQVTKTIPLAWSKIPYPVQESEIVMA
jgi:hypothetical protein